MQPAMPVTGYARLTRRQARIVLAVTTITGAFFVALTLSPLRVKMPETSLGNTVGWTAPGEGDVQLYRAVVDRVHAGEGYYRAFSVEMPKRGYPTGSVFNWRSPLPIWLIGVMPAIVLGKILLGTLALIAFLAAYRLLAREDHRSGRTSRRPTACLMLLIAPLLPTVLGDLFVMPSLWAGVLIVLSVCLYGLNRPRLGLVAGLAAVFLRELAMPYCIVAAAIAWWHRRRGELAAWALGLGVWAVIYAVHCLHAAGMILPDAKTHSEGWLQCGGAAFVIATVRMNTYLLLLPQWVTALYLTAALLGLAGWHTPTGRRTGLTVCLFLTAFALVGQDFNQYWGLLPASLICLGVVRFPVSLREVWQAAEVGVIGQKRHIPQRLTENL